MEPNSFDTVTFTSPRFKPLLPDDCQVNPGRYGAELAYWLCTELAQANIIASYPNYEDWGWFLDYRSETGEEFRLCCGNVDGGEEQWMCFLEPLSKGLFKGKADPASASRLRTALGQLLENSPDISDIEWSKESK